MKSKSSQLQDDYRPLLGQYLCGKSALKEARALGRRAVGDRLEVLDIVKLHERSVRSEASSLVAGTKLGDLVKRAGRFFAEVVAPLEKNQRISQKAASRARKLIQTLDRRTLELAASEQELKKEIARRAQIEAALKKSERHYRTSLEESRRLQEQLRYLSRQILSTQEEERKRISRELHDQIAGSLNGINIELSYLRKDAAGKDKILNRKIARTQRLVRDSVDIIHGFARDLRPPLLDDLGLVPALASLVKTLFKETGVRVRVNVSVAVEALGNLKQTVLYRVAQEALTNVVKHARAASVSVDIRPCEESICLSIHDNGKSFDVNRLLCSPGNNRLGLLGMRERVEMVGGTFRVTSDRGNGTTVSATVPLDARQGNLKPHERRSREKPALGK